MKTLFIYLNQSEADVNSVCENVRRLLPEKCFICWINKPSASTRETSEAILSDLSAAYEGNYQNLVVVYSGKRLYSLKEKFPCDSINADKLFANLKKTIGGYKTPKEKEMVDSLFIGGIMELLKQRRK